ncbi:hypothetical protein ACTI_81450 [Actinoplanes sp. OR16]|uniref:hypothetical protein n=1 Tax=Actinoplanes sp. OR16 TaxID=946334 RepID=UPI000F6C4AA6|nr:hypothetical protein [Actinoplanes sp. OR16]BBH71460.1 hypothetical protein ACTI_81450 [Actinoplanes sp. OR16]
MAADPHIHIDARLGGQAASRAVLASAFGLAADLPPTVRSGCGLEVARAMTSVRPESVTCLTCREFGAEAHERLAAQVESLGVLPGSPLTPAQVHEAAAHHRDLARRFTRG